MSLVSRKKIQFGLAVCATTFMVSCQCFPPVDTQRKDLTEFKSIPVEKKTEMIQEYSNMLYEANDTSETRHCCYFRCNQALFNLSDFLRDGTYAKTNRQNYEKVVNYMWNMAAPNSNLNKLTTCLSGANEARLEQQQVRLSALRALRDLNDPNQFPSFLAHYGMRDVSDIEANNILLDGLYIYFPQNDTLDNRVKTLESILIKCNQNESWAKQARLQQLTERCLSFPALTQLIDQLKTREPLCTRALALNLNYWHSVQNSKTQFDVNQAWANIQLLRKLSIATKNDQINGLIHNTLADIVPAENLAVWNARLEGDNDFKNAEGMLVAVGALRKNNVKADERFAKLSGTTEIFAKTDKLAELYISKSLFSLPTTNFRRISDLAAVTYPKVLYARYLKELRDPQCSYDNVRCMNTIIAEQQKLGKYTADQVKEINTAILNLLSTASTRTDYMMFFKEVDANVADPHQKFQVLQSTVLNNKITNKADFFDAYVKTAQACGEAVNQDFYKGTQQIMFSLETPVLLKAASVYEERNEGGIFLSLLFNVLIDQHKLTESRGHLTLLGENAAKYVEALRQNPELYQKYLKIFRDGIASKDDEVSLLCMDYAMRICKDERNDIRAEYEKRWHTIDPVNLEDNSAL